MCRRSTIVSGPANAFLNAYTSGSNPRIMVCEFVVNFRGNGEIAPRDIVACHFTGKSSIFGEILIIVI